MKKLDCDFFKQDAKLVAQQLLGKYLCVNTGEKILRAKIIETEAYYGSEDSASHARFGQKGRSNVMWKEGGRIYVYLCYGLHNMINIVTGKLNEPSAVLIRGVEGAVGPGKVTKSMQISMQDNDKLLGERVWIEEGNQLEFECLPRVGINYANEKDRVSLLRFVAKNIN